MYYDSIIDSGELKWQSMLNDKNKVWQKKCYYLQIFYDACDMFFTDYHWDEPKLANSSKNADDVSYKIFTGIDIWGRGAYMGGQFNSHLGVKVSCSCQM